MSDKWPELPEDRRVYFGLALLFMILWLAARAYAIYPLLKTGTENPRLSGPDSYFHLRHAEYVVQDYPRIRRRDRMATYPYETTGINQGFYDLFVATLSKLTLQTVSPIVVLTWLAPVLTGLSALMLAGWLGRRQSPRCALLFLMLVLTFPGVLTQVAAVGEGDHHAWEVFLQVSLLLSLDWSFGEKKPLPCVLLPGLLLGIIFVSWAGSPLHLFFVGLSVYALAFAGHPAEKHKLLMGKGALLGLIITGLPLLAQQFAPTWIPWHRVVSLFVGAGAALTLGFPILVYGTQKVPRKFRGAAAIGGLIVLLVLIRLSSPSLWGLLMEFISPRSTSISEHAAVNPRSLFFWYGVTPLALIAAPVLIWLQGRTRVYHFPLVYGVGLVLFWALTRDFNYYAPLYIALMAAYCLSRLPWRSWTPAIVILILAVSLLPIKQARPWLTHDNARELMLHTEGIQEASRFLTQIKEESGEDYGLLTPWDLGNLLAYTTKTGVAYSQTHSTNLAKLLYSDDIGELSKYMEKRNLRFCVVPSRNVEDKFGTEYMLTGHQPKELMMRGSEVKWDSTVVTLPAFNERYYSLNIIRLFDLLARNLGHFRLVFESKQRMVRTIKLTDDLKSFAYLSLQVTDEEAQALGPIFREKNKVLPTSRGLLVNPRLSTDVRIFEWVPGALIVGQTKDPNQPVGAYLSISSPYSDSPRVVTWKTKSNEKGRFSLRLPYPTGGPLYQVEGSIVVNGTYRVECNDKLYEVALTEEQIQSEAKLPLKNFPLTEK